MNTPRVILIGFALVAAAVYFSRDVGPAQAAFGSPDFAIAGTGASNFIWRVRTSTGQVSICYLNGRIISHTGDSPECSP